MRATNICPPKWRKCITRQVPKKVTSTEVARIFKRSPQKWGPQRKLIGKEELVLVLMKLRPGLINDFLCDLFDVGKGTCSQILNTWVRFLSRELRPLVFWPDRITITKMLPSQLAAKYPSLRCTLDCTEVFIERPRHMELVVDLVRLQEAQYGEIPDWYSPKC